MEDTIPAQVRLDTVVTGTYNFPGTYKITYRVNGGEYRTLADNLSTSKNYILQPAPRLWALPTNERVTEVMFVFGQAPAGFAQVETPYLNCTAVANLPANSKLCQYRGCGRRIQRDMGAGHQPVGNHGLWQAHPAPPHRLLIHTLGVHSSGWTPFPYTLKYNIL